MPLCDCAAIATGKHTQMFPFKRPETVSLVASFLGDFCFFQVAPILIQTLCASFDRLTFLCCHKRQCLTCHPHPSPTHHTQPQKRFYSPTSLTATAAKTNQWIAGLIVGTTPQVLSLPGLVGSLARLLAASKHLDNAQHTVLFHVVYESSLAFSSQFVPARRSLHHVCCPWHHVYCHS